MVVCCCLVPCRSRTTSSMCWWWCHRRCHVCHVLSSKTISPTECARKPKQVNPRGRRLFVAFTGERTDAHMYIAHTYVDKETHQRQPVRFYGKLFHLCTCTSTRPEKRKMWTLMKFKIFMEVNVFILHSRPGARTATKTVTTTTCCMLCVRQRNDDMHRTRKKIKSPVRHCLLQINCSACASGKE